MYDRSVIGDLYFDETYDRHEDYILWVSILKRGIVAKGNHNFWRLMLFVLTARIQINQN